MGNEAGIALCYRVARDLAKFNVHTIAMATDGDRSYVGYQNSLFQRYQDLLGRPLEELCHVAAGSCFQAFWWVADPLHALKCQRCRLKNKLFIKPTEVFSAVSLNLKLKLKYSLTELNGASKMNDIFAVQLFSIDNLITLFDANQSAISLSEIEYLTPFVLWYVVVAVSDLTRKVRLNLLEIVFRIFTKWYQILPALPARKLRDNDRAEPSTNTITDIKERFICFAVEAMDLVRYMNSVLFLYTVIKSVDDIALNRIGTHPLENYFRTVRLASNYDH
jgi:hypothetical protein